MITKNIYNLEIEDYTLAKEQGIFIFSDERDFNFINGKDLTLYQRFKRIDRIPGYDFLMAIQISKSITSTNMYIKYKSFGDVLSAFGGSFEVLRNIFEPLLGLFINNFYITGLMNRVYRYHNNTYASQIPYKQYKDLFIEKSKNAKVNGNQSLHKNCFCIRS